MSQDRGGREMANGGTDHHITWHCALLFSSEHCTFRESDVGYRFHGVVVTPLADLPCHIDYSIVVDRGWRTREVSAMIATPRGRREMNVRSLDNGGWEVDGVSAPHLDDCGDVDLGWTPATNTIPIRRLALAINESRDIIAAWIRFPELDVVQNVQTYTRLASDRWRYQSGDYDFELDVDPRTGLVLAYGDDLWRASALSL